MTTQNLENTPILTEEALAKAKSVGSIVCSHYSTLQKLSILSELVSIRELMINCGFEMLTIESSDEYDDNNYYTGYSFGSYTMIDVPKEQFLNYMKAWEGDIQANQDWLEEIQSDHEIKTLEDVMEVYLEDSYFLQDMSTDYDLSSVFPVMEEFTVEGLDTCILQIMTDGLEAIPDINESLQKVA